MQSAHRVATSPWRRRFSAPRTSLPLWARDAPQRCLYGTNASGKWELYAWDRGGDRHRQVTDRPTGTLPGFGRLDPTGEHIWWFDDDAGNELGRWMVEPFAGGAARRAVPGLADAYGAGLGFSAPGVAVIGASRPDGTTVYLVRAGHVERELYAHREHAWVSSLSHDGTLIGINHSEHGDSRHPAVRVITLDGRVVGDLWDGPGLGLFPATWPRVGGDQRLIVHHERQGVRRPLVWNLLTGTAEEIPLDLPGEVTASWYPDGTRLLLTHDHRARSRLYRYDLGRAELTAIETEPGTITAARVRPDGDVWYAWSRSSTPPEIRSDAGVLLRPGGPAAPGGVAYGDLDLGPIHALVAEPAGPRPHPTIMLVHGGPESHDMDTYSAMVQAWVDHGYAVVLVNDRGSTGYGRTWRDAITGNPGFTEMEDLCAVRDHLVASGLTDPRRMILSGRSWGGYLTLLGLGRHPDRWSLGIAAVPVADYVAAYEDEMEPLKAYDKALFGGAPDELAEAYRARSPITYVEDVAVPVFILAGENDPRCPIRQIDNYLARLAELGKPHDVYRYDAGHSSLVIDEQIKQMDKELAFAAHHLGTIEPR
ncbi:MAG TPA: alpha/beta fold hydrolase [bacterium]|nr:alpha/beta fold hydrolase [bacterium]